MRVLVCGDRNWTDWTPLRRELSKLPPGSIIIEGDCRGADKMAGFVAKQLGFDVVIFPADWNTHGKAAGPIRNRQMLTDGKPDEVWAFHADLNKSKGTADMVGAARRANLVVKVFDR